MKNRINLVVVLLAVVMAVVAASANAQTGSKANMPFGFNVRGENVPSGVCVARMTNSGAVLIETSDIKGPRALILARISDAGNSERTHNKWVFRRYGTSYFLAKIYVSGRVIEIPKSRMEKNLIKELKLQQITKNDGSPAGSEVVEIAAIR